MTTYRGTTNEEDLKASSKDFPKLRISRGNHNETGRSGGVAACLKPTSPGRWHARVGNHNCRGSPREARGPSSTLGSPARAALAGKLRDNRLERQPVLCTSQRAPGKAKASLKRHKVPPAQRPSREGVFQRRLGQSCLLHLQKPTRAVGGRQNAPWGHRCWRQPFTGAI